MKTFDYLTVKEARTSLQSTYDTVFKIAESGDFVDQHLLNASMNIKAGLVEIDRAISAHDINKSYEFTDPTDILNKTLDVLANGWGDKK